MPDEELEEIMTDPIRVRRNPHSGDIYVSEPTRVFDSIVFETGKAGHLGLEGPGNGGNISFQPAPGGAIIFCVPEGDPHIAGALYTESGFLKVSNG